MSSLADVAAAPGGLTAGEVQQRRERGQANDYQALTSRSMREILRTNIFTRFNALLGSLFVVILVVGPFQDALFGVALVTNTLIGVVQEWRAKRALDRLALVTAPQTTVVRNGIAQAVPADAVVIDDVLALAAGDQLVADATVVASEGLRLDESLLTGESHPVDKHPQDPLLSGSLVVAGAGRCVVTAVGADRYAAQLETKARHFTLARSELRDGLNRILRIITWVLVPTAVLLFWSQTTSSGTTTEDALRGAVAGTVTMVPEGLILLASVAFAVGAIRLARRRVLARELPSIEGLARVDTLCIDKTGTLTTGRLTVADVVDLEPSEPIPDALAALARVDPRPNATAAALAVKFPTDAPWPARRHYPFSSETKWSGADFGSYGIWLVGAPDVLLPRDAPLLRRVDELSKTGARLLLLARATSTATPATEAMPSALVVLRDEIRTDAAETLRFLQAQGVAVKVLSGDHPATVAAVAAQVGLEPGVPVDARTLDAPSASVADTLDEHTVFGRVTPEQKSAFVDALQRRGHVVAMTGDGINDVLALKNADVGIAMGAGSPATRAVAQLVLLDNAFTAVPNVIAEGRRVIANMERVANLFLTKTVYATVLAITVGIAKLPFPFLPRHLTLISTLTIGVPAFILALAPNAARARPHFVARVARFAVPTGLIAAGATYLAYVEARADDRTSLTAARTLCTIVLLSIALWVLAILERTGRHRERWLVPAMVAAFLVVLAWPAARVFFALSIPRPLVVFAGVGVAALAGVALEAGWTGISWVKQLRAQSRRMPSR